MYGKKIHKMDIAWNEKIKARRVYGAAWERNVKEKIAHVAVRAQWKWPEVL